MAKVKRVNLDIPQGTTFRHDFTYVDSDNVPIPLTGYTARCQFREETDDSVNFFEATTENGKIVIDAPNGLVSLRVEPADSTPWTTFEGVYDIEIVAPNSDVTRIVQGSVFIDREVTR